MNGWAPKLLTAEPIHSAEFVVRVDDKVDVLRQRILLGQELAC